MTLVKDPTRKTFGYMPLLEPRFQGLEHLVLNETRPVLRIFCQAAIFRRCFRKTPQHGRMLQRH